MAMPSGGHPRGLCDQNQKAKNRADSDGRKQKRVNHSIWRSCGRNAVCSDAHEDPHDEKKRREKSNEGPPRRLPAWNKLDELRPEDGRDRQNRTDDRKNLPSQRGGL